VRPEAVALLRCPHCGEDLRQSHTSLCCGNGHVFDIARQGYVNLLPGDAQASTGDTPAMVAARETFLAAGHFEHLRRLLAGAVAASLPASGGGGGGGPAARAGRPVVLEVGAGTGYYLAGALDRLPDSWGLALDLSKHASRRAARAHERMAAVVCDVWRPLPVKSRSVAVVLDVFAPRNPAEFQRILEPEGSLVIATPTPNHLRELVQTLGLLTVDHRKYERLDKGLTGLFEPVERTSHEETLRLTQSEVLALVCMGPSARHIAPDELAARVSALPAMTGATLSVTISTYRRPG